MKIKKLIELLRVLPKNMDVYYIDPMESHDNFTKYELQGINIGLHKTKDEEIEKPVLIF